MSVMVPTFLLFLICMLAPMIASPLLASMMRPCSVDLDCVIDAGEDTGLAIIEVNGKVSMEKTSVYLAQFLEGGNNLASIEVKIKS